ncbi:MAG: tRNA lysidine(34) synthetase TilS [Weeksellaceae bacterium]
MDLQKDFEIAPEYKNHKLLAAVSGGVDSMVLCHLLLKSGVNFSVVHCNFGLRAEASDEDEKFVKKFCQKHQIQFFSKNLNVEKFMKTGNYSVQMAARILRYEWFDELMQKESFQKLLTAHHLDDAIETFLINLSRGTGIKGLSGIQAETEKIYRPLLPFSKEQILKYARENQIEWREDATNAEKHYVRNKIRHEIIPVLKEIHPEFYRNFLKTQKIIREEVLLVKQKTDEIKNLIFQKKDNQILIEIEDLKALQPSESILYHLFSPFDFYHPSEILKLIHSKNNGEIRSATHRLIKNRGEFILLEIEKQEEPMEIEFLENRIHENSINLKVELSGSKDPNATETLDAEKICFPLKLRKVKAGDRFIPLGLKGFKKLSKFFVDEKYAKPEKEKAWILVDNDDKILYLIGKRIDDRYKMTDDTHKYLNIYLC